MATMQKFTTIGITTCSEQGTKIRFSDDMVRRIKLYQKRGATRVDFIDLPEPMLKLDALYFMQKHSAFQSKADQTLISECIAERVLQAKRDHQRLVKPRKPRGQNKVRQLTAHDLLSMFRQTVNEVPTSAVDTEARS